MVNPLILERNGEVISRGFQNQIKGNRRRIKSNRKGVYLEELLIKVVQKNKKSSKYISQINFFAL